MSADREDLEVTAQVENFDPTSSEGHRDPRPWLHGKERLTAQQVSEGNLRGVCWDGLVFDPRSDVEPAADEG